MQQNPVVKGPQHLHNTCQPSARCSHACVGFVRCFSALLSPGVRQEISSTLRRTPSQQIYSLNTKQRQLPARLIHLARFVSHSPGATCPAQAADGPFTPPGTQQRLAPPPLPSPWAPRAGSTDWDRCGRQAGGCTSRGASPTAPTTTCRGI